MKYAGYSAGSIRCSYNRGKMWCVLPLDLMGCRWSKQPSRVGHAWVRCGGWHQSLQIGEQLNFKADRKLFLLRRQRAESLKDSVKNQNPLNYKEIKPVIPKGNQLWIFIGRTDAEAEAPVLWPDAKNLWKRPWCWERMKARGEGDDRGWDGWWHHWLNGHESEQIPGDSEGQGSLACCSPWGHSQTWLSNWTTTKPISVKHKQTMSFFLNVACDSASPCL